MEKIDLTGMTYEQLCELDEQVSKLRTDIGSKKREFMYLSELYIYNEDNQEPDLYRSYYRILGFVTTILTTAVFNDRRWSIRDMLEDQDQDLNKHSLLYYLISNGIELEYKIYSKEEIAALWEPIKIKLMNDKLDKGQAKINTKK